MNTKQSTTTTTRTSAGIADRWSTLRDELRERRQKRIATAALERQLTGYHSRGDILDLLAAADRHDGPNAELMRSVLQSKLAHAGRGSYLAG